MGDVDRIGRYEVLRLLGRGGMGEVYLARDPLIDRPLAVKVLSAAFDDAARARFRREAQAAGRLDHENIVTVFDVGDHHGLPFIAMEYVPGETLGELIRKAPPLEITSLTRLLEDACSGLAIAHRAGVVHLDVKPENMIRRDDGRLKVLDFGIARVLESDQTQTINLLGTLRYMSPEQLSCQPVDHRSDVYALGCVLFEVVARRPAFSGTMQEAASRLSGRGVSLPEIVPGVDPELARITARAMAFDPAQRYDDLGTMRQELAIWRQSVEAARESVTFGPARTLAPALPAPAPVPTKQHSRRAPVRTQLTRTRWRQAAIVGAFAAAVAIAGARWWARSTNPQGTALEQSVATPAETAGVPDETLTTRPPSLQAAIPAPLAKPVRPAPPGEVETTTVQAPAPQTRGRMDRPPDVVGAATGARETAAITSGAPELALETAPAGAAAASEPAAMRPDPAGTSVPPTPASGAPANSNVLPPERDAPNSMPPASTDSALDTSGSPRHQDAISAVLRAYEQAHDQKSIDGIRAVFPSFTRQQAEATARTFAGAVSYRVTLQVRDLKFDEVTAVATCQVTHELVPKVGTPSRNTATSRFHLRRVSGDWLIERVESAGAR